MKLFRTKSDFSFDKNNPDYEMLNFTSISSPLNSAIDIIKNPQN